MRHGETIDNVRQIMQGQTQGALTENGIRQAEQLRDQLKDVHFDAFVSSDLRRAIDTCAIIAQPHALPVCQTPLLRERDWGGFTGMFIPDLKDKTWPDDIETLDQLKARAAQFMDYVRVNWPNGTVLAVGHGIINKAIQSVYHGLPMNQVQKMINAEVRTLQL